MPSATVAAFSSVVSKARAIVNEYDKKMTESGDFSLTREANEALCTMAREQTADALTKVLQEASARMKNGFNLADN